MRDWHLISAVGGVADDLGEGVAWAQASKSSQVPNPLRQTVLAHARGHLISWERLLTDAHSGRLLGTIGVIVADIAVLLLLVLGATGIIFWMRGR